MKKPSGKRILFLALGSTGDILPYATLARAMHDAGYRPTFVTSQDFEPLLNELGLAGRFVPGDAQKTIAQAGADARRLMLAFAEISRDLPDVLDPSAPWLREAAAVVNQLPIGLYGYDLAERLGIPHIKAAVIPLTETADFPMMGFPSRLARLPAYNRVGYRLYEHLTWLTMRRTIVRWRTERLGLRSISSSRYLSRLRRQPTLYGFSPQVVPRPADWPSDTHITGYWFPRDEAWPPPESLVHFLEAGPPPVFVGFGSMPVTDPLATTQMIVEATRAGRNRTIIQAGWAGLAQGDLPEHIYRLEYAPYNWLFPRTSAIIHHGGSGTTAAGLRAGVPGLIISFTFDQGFWGRRLADLGVGLPPIPFHRLTPSRLDMALNQLTTDGSMKARAAELGQRICEEDGIARVVQLVVSYLD